MEGTMIKEQIKNLLETLYDPTVKAKLKQIEESYEHDLNDGKEVKNDNNQKSI
jgi:metal-sulfur cluster biosynthetic enzyme